MDFSEILGKLGFDSRVFIFNVINIVVVLFLMRKFIVTPVLKLISERKKLIDEGFNQEQEARKLVEEANFEAKKIIVNAIDESKEIVQNAKLQGVKQAEAIIDDANLKANKILQNADIEALNKEKTVMEKAREKIVDMVTIATAKVVAVKQ